ncbi:hypothetical protein [Sandaracinus amylolyticus]|uniref:hypothetical protein n=1 Tax=Sandaracinus amylolyticus TaxID=927083 RepID=UPI001F3CD08A|nr:hypothetical protein [Sandaracinus amylolyticus]
MTPRPTLFLSILALALAITPRALAQDVVIIVPAEPAPPPPSEPIAPAPVAEVAVEPAPEPEPEPDVFAPGFFSIGLSGLVGLRDAPHHEISPTWTSGIDVGFRVLPWLSVGARRIGYGHATTLVGDRHAIGASPALELTMPLWERVQPYAQVGAGVQVRFGGAQGRTTGIAPFIGGGVRFFVAEIFSIAVESAMHVPVTEDGFLFGHEVLPQGSVVLQGGLAFAFHIQ